MIDDKQCTTVFHMDDVMMSYDSAKVVTKCIEKSDSSYGKQHKLKVTRGLVHEYLGMTVDLWQKGQVVLSQFDFFKEIVQKTAKMYEGRLSEYSCTSKLIQAVK